MLIEKVSFTYGGTNEEWIDLILILYKGETEVWGRTLRHWFVPEDVLSWVPNVEADRFYWKALDVDFIGSYLEVDGKRIDLRIANDEWQEGWMSLSSTGGQKILLIVASIGTAILGFLSIFKKK